jgi:hypothetical protein
MARIAQRERQAADEAAAMPDKLGKSVVALVRAVGRYEHVFGAPDGGFTIAVDGTDRLEVSGDRFVVRAKDGTIRGATPTDLKAVGLDREGALRGAVLRPLKAALGLRPSSRPNEASLDAAVADAIDRGKASIAALHRHPDVLRLIAQPRASKKRGAAWTPIELLDSTSDAKLDIDRKGKLHFRFGALARTPTPGDIAWLGLSEARPLRELLGRRLVDGMGAEKSSAASVRRAIDQAIDERNAAAASRRAQAEKRKQATALLQRTLDWNFDREEYGYQINPNYRFLAELLQRSKKDNISLASIDGHELLLFRGDASECARLRMWSPDYEIHLRTDNLARVGITTRAQLNAAFKRAVLQLSIDEM